MEYEALMCPFRKVTKKSTQKQYQQGSCGVMGIGDPTILKNLGEPINYVTVEEDFMPCLLERCPFYKKVEGKDGQCTRV